MTIFVDKMYLYIDLGGDVPDQLVQVNTSMDLETVKVLEQMARDAGYDNRSAFIRLLIRREAARQGRAIGETLAVGISEKTTEQPR